MPGKLVVFRCDAGPQIGAGHLVRCLTLADKLAQEGWRCRFVLNSDAKAFVPGAAQSRYDLHFLGEAERYSVRPVLARAGELVVVDHYKLGADFELSCREYFGVVMAIDDPPCRRHQCDILLNQNAGIEAELGDMPGVRHYLGGTQYAMLRPEFARLRSKSLKERSRKGVVRQIFVSFGSSDLHDMCGQSVRTILDSGIEADIDIVVSASSPNVSDLKDLARETQPRVSLHLDAENVASLMANADLAIGAAGTMTWERCCLGLPSIVYICADNQNLIARAIDKSGAAIVVGNRQNFESDVLAYTLTSLTADGRARQEMAQSAAALCDGEGSNRVLAQINDAMSVHVRH